MEHSVIQSAGNVEEFSCDFFEELDLGRCHGEEASKQIEGQDYFETFLPTVQ